MGRNLTNTQLSVKHIKVKGDFFWLSDVLNHMVEKKMWVSLYALYIYFLGMWHVCNVICWCHINAVVIDLICTTAIFLTVEVENYLDYSHKPGVTSNISYWQKLQRKQWIYVIGFFFHYTIFNNRQKIERKFVIIDENFSIWHLYQKPISCSMFFRKKMGLSSFSKNTLTMQEKTPQILNKHWCKDL